MGTAQIGRRTFLTRALAAIGATNIVLQAGYAQSVPNSAGTDAPKLKAPSNACDCHHHIYDGARFPQPSGASRALIPNARVADFRLFQKRLGMTRYVIVTPSAYDTDNRVTLDAIEQLGSNARGIARLIRLQRTRL